MHDDENGTLRICTNCNLPLFRLAVFAIKNRERKRIKKDLPCPHE